MRIFYAIIMIMVLLLEVESYSLEDAQIEHLYKIYNYSKEFVNKDGKNYKTLILAIANVESSLCKNLIGDVYGEKTIDDISIGCFQFQLKTAMWYIQKDKRLRAKYGKWSKWKVAQHLLSDLKFQVELVSRYIEYITNRYGTEGIWRYNGSRVYQQKIRKAIKENKEILKKYWRK